MSLPHLSSPIESIVVSPGGAAYGIRLADNSTMVISTLDHNPIFNVSGVQVPPPTTTKEAWKGPHASKLHGRRYPAVASRLNPYHILSATPSVVSTRNGPSQSTSKSYLQTIDTRHGTQVAKQALVRTKVTDLSLGPEGNVIDEPNVVLLRGSSDGKWLATVEEWMPPLSDTIDVDFTMEQARLTQKAGFETCLKFWLWNEDTKSWDLSTRFDKPHCSDANVDPSACHILDLLELPSSIGFVTVGVDGKVRVWKPRVRTRNASDVKERAGRALYTWSCRRAVYLPVSEIVSDGICRMAISHDDSLLVTAHQHNDRSITHLVNLNDGEIKMTRCNFFSGKLKGAGVVGRFLVLLADQLNVWNLVDDKLQYAINLRTSHYFARGSPEIYLAIDQIHETFAIAFSTSERVSKVTVFSPAAPALIFDGQAHQDREVVALIPATHQKGYHVIDSSSEITTITPRPVNTIATTEDSEESLQAPSSSRLNITLAPQPLKQSGKESDAGIPLRLHNASHEDDAVHIRQEDISRLLRSEDPLSMPSVATLFERVALYIGGRKESRPSI